MHASISFSISALLALSTLPNPSDARSWSLKPWARGRDHSKLINERKVMGTRTVTVKATRTKTIWVGAETATVGSFSSSAAEGTTSASSMIETVLPSSTQSATEQAGSSASSESMVTAGESSSIWQTESAEVTGTASFSSWASEATMTASASASPSTTADDDEDTSSSGQTSEASATETASSTASAESSATESFSGTTEVASPIPTSMDEDESSSLEALPTTSEAESSVETAGPASATLPPNLVLNPTSISINSSESTGSASISNTASSSVALPEPTELASTVDQESQILTMPLATGTDSSSSASQATATSVESEAAASSIVSFSSSLAYQPGWNAPGAIPSYPPFGSASQSSVAEASVTVIPSSTNTPTAATASQSAYLPNGQAPGAIPAYPSFVGSNSSSVAQASMTESASANSRSAAPSATSSAYAPNGQAPGAIPGYPSFISSSQSFSVQASQTDTSAIAPATSSDATATQSQSESTETASETATQSASTASSWWSSWVSASSATSESAPAPATLASETVSVSVTASETATLSASASSSAVASTPSSSTSAPNPIVTGRTGLSTTPLANKMTAGWYPDWTVWTYPVSALDWSKLDVVDFAFAIPDANFQLQFLQYNSLDTLRELVSAGHSAGKKVRLSIGGWTGSVYFSAAVSNDQNRQTFANNIATVYRDYNLDGIDLDWEYPGGGGAWGNGQDSNDTANYLTFFQVLRKTLPPQALISSATQVTPFRDSGGAPSTDMSGFAQVLDWITIMNYDIWSSSNDNPGPNAPLDLGCGRSDMDWANAAAAVGAWEKAGMPSNQIMLGIAAYGYLQMSSASRLRTRRRDLDARAMVTVKNPNGDSGTGQINFASLIDQGALKRDPATGNWIGDNGFTREWDDCSSTPWLKSPYSGQLITYDDPQSISMKAQFARQAGLRGTSVWEITGDMGGSNWSLLTAARSGLGI